MLLCNVCGVYVSLVNIELRYTRGRMAQCYHKACDGWDPSTRSPESPRFLAAVTRAVLDSVLEMAEEDVVNEDTAEVEADKDDMIMEDIDKEDMIKEDDVLEETTVRADVAASLRNKESPTATRESEVAPVPRKGFAKFFHFGPKIEN